MSLRRKLIDAGVRNLREFGYGAADANNILTDPVFTRFFKSMLEENKGHSADYDLAIDGLLEEIGKAA